MSKNHYTHFSTTWRKFQNSVRNLQNNEGLEFKYFVRLCATLHIIQSLLVHKHAINCRKISSNDFCAFHRFADVY